jgi:hypothetical protein
MQCGVAPLIYDKNYITIMMYFYEKITIYGSTIKYGSGARPHFLDLKNDEMSLVKTQNDLI